MRDSGKYLGPFLGLLGDEEHAKAERGAYLCRRNTNSAKPCLVILRRQKKMAVKWKSNQCKETQRWKGSRWNSQTTVRKEREARKPRQTSHQTPQDGKGASREEGHIGKEG